MIAELAVVSTAFAAGAAIPAEFCCSRVSPPISWRGAPEGAASFALICDDPDAPGGDWVHWVVFNLPPETTALGKAVSRNAALPKGAVEGTTDYNRTGYDGPCPPPGKAHRYFFTVYALDTKLDLGPDAEKKHLLKAMAGHILAKGSIYGTFKR